MARYTLAAISEGISCQLVGSGSAVVDHLAIDSRQLHPHDSTLFVAIKGSHHDGHAHVQEMYDAGTRCFVVERPDGLPQDANYLVVDDSLRALQMLAIWHRSSSQITSVGITGSNGKTIVKEWLNELIGDSKSVIRSPGSWNSQIGVALSIWRIEERHTIGLFEAGISRPNEMDRLKEMIAPQMGIFTNLGPAHSEGFESDKHKAAEKAQLFSECESVVCCRDHQVVVDALLNAGLGEERLLTWSRQGKAPMQILSEEETAYGKKCIVRYEGKAHELDIPFSDDASAENIFHAVLAGLALGVTFRVLKERVRELQPLDMRLQLIEGKGGSTILNDAYSNDPISLNIALDRLRAIASSRSKVAILSTMEDVRKNDLGANSALAEMLRRAELEKVYVIGPNPDSYKGAGITLHYPDTEALLRSIKEEEFVGKAILIKGSRKYQLERIVERLRAKSHGAVLEVNLSAIKHNLDTYRDLLDERTSVMVMLKAFGYGGGATEIARLLEYEKIDGIGVAYATEGVQLRQDGITTPILVMNTADTGWDVFNRFELQPTVHSIPQLSSLIAYMDAGGGVIDIHLELDSGMNRLGIKKSELDGLLDLIRVKSKVYISSVFSHLAASDSEIHDDFTNEQIDTFNNMFEHISKVLGYAPKRHILNSSGISRHSDHQMDMVRLGIGLYGYDGTLERNTLRPALSLSAAISQIKHVREGESVGYGRSYIADRDTRIAVLPIGYADGLRRTLSNGVGNFWIGNKAVPIVGKVCMDMTMIDVTNVTCEVGTQAWLFDERRGMDDLCAALETIPYEVLCSLSTRIERRYVRDA